MNISNRLKLVALSIVSTSVNAQLSNNNDIKVQAVIESGCYLTANNINFGTLIMPLSNQAASSNMNIKCSKNAPYDIQIGYGTNVSINTSNGNYTSQINFDNGRAQAMKIYQNGAPISTSTYDLECNHNLYINQVHFHNLVTAQLFGYTNIGWQPSDDLCINRGAKINANWTSFINGGQIGALVGLSNGEKIAFEILNPNNQNWADNKHSAIGSGEDQTITMKAQINKDSSPTHRLSADNYQSSVTVQLSY